MNSEPNPGRADDPSIGDDEILWRRILPDWVHREPDGSTRPQSIAMVDRNSGELSVHIAALTTVEAILKKRPGDYVVAFRAGAPRGWGLKVVRDPDPDDPSHALVCPSPNQSQAKKLARCCVWVGTPPS